MESDQGTYYSRHRQRLRAKAREYRLQWTAEQRQRKRCRDLAYYYRAKQKISERRKSRRTSLTEEQRQQERLRKRKHNRTPRGQYMHRLASKRFYDQHRDTILQRQRERYRQDAKRLLIRQKSQQGQTESHHLVTLTPLSVRLQLCRNRQDQLCAYRDHCLFAARSIPLESEDIVVPPEPFSRAREETIDVVT